MFVKPNPDKKPASSRTKRATLCLKYRSNPAESAPALYRSIRISILTRKAHAVVLTIQPWLYAPK